MNDILYKSEVEQIKLQMDIEDIPEIEITVEDIKEILNTIYVTLTTSNDRLLLKKFMRTMVDSIIVLDRTTANMKVNLKFTEELLRLFNKQVPSNVEFKYEDSVD